MNYADTVPPDGTPPDGSDSLPDSTQGAGQTSPPTPPM
jgi:hypothetical protein